MYSTWPHDDVAQRNPQCTWRNVKMDRLAASATDCYRVQYHNVASCSIYECLFERSSTTNILHCHLVHTKNTSPPTILEIYVSLPALTDMFRSKYARRVRPWSFSMHCRWQHWGRGMHLLPLQRHTRETSLSTWLPMPAVGLCICKVLGRVNISGHWRP